MSEIYHAVPPEMIGDELIPLNELRDEHPDLYERNASKYNWRTHVMENVIPQLDNAKWNDVLHNSPVHPQKVHEALVETGHPGLKGRSFYEINIEDLDPDKLIIFKYLPNRKHNTAEDFEPFTRARLEQIRDVPEISRRYFTRMAELGERPLIYGLIPHVLYMGRILVKNAPTVEIQ